jgi:hypothetical protein
MKNPFITGNINIQGKSIPLITTKLEFADLLGTVMVRWGFNRDKYRVAPGLYAVGSTQSDSDVFVTSNYKLTFDQVRKNLGGFNAFLLLLDTKGVNVWCAAGKGTFGTEELAGRIKSSSLENIVTHRRLILPQLGATGIAAHKIKEMTGFNVHYGPVRASDIKRFVSNGYRADKDMRKVKFGFTDRIKLIPNDFMYGKYYLLGAIAILLLISAIGPQGFSFRNVSSAGLPAALKIFMAYFAGIVLTPIMLPYLPGRHFSLKGFFAGMLIFVGSLFFNTQYSIETIAWFFLTGALSSFVAMNFTGSSTFTSLSGVKKEMKLFLPLQIGFAATGIILIVISKFLNIL